MTAQKGLSMLLKIGNINSSPVTVAGLQTNTLTLNNEKVDVTTKDSSGWQALLANAGVQSLQLTANGIAVSDSGFKTLQQNAFNNTISEYCMFFNNDCSIDGFFQITKFEVSGAYNKEQTFTCTLESSGTLTTVLT